MAFTPTEEALLKQLAAQNASLLNLAASETTIISKLGATKVTLSDLDAVTTPADADIMLARQGTDDKGLALSLLKEYSQGGFTTSRALVSDSSGKVAVSAVTATELGYVDGVTSAIQTQLNAKVALTGNQTVAGVKTFSSSPVVPTATAGDSSTKAASTAFVSGAVADIDEYTDADALAWFESYGKSLTESGYQKLPSGLIIQWGSFNTGSIVNNATGSQSFPISFTTACFQTIVGSTAGVISTSGSTSEGFRVISETISGFSWGNHWISRDDAYGAIKWISIGR